MTQHIEKVWKKNVCGKCLKGFEIKQLPSRPEGEKVHTCAIEKIAKNWFHSFVTSLCCSCSCFCYKKETKSTLDTESFREKELFRLLLLSQQLNNPKEWQNSISKLHNLLLKTPEEKKPKNQQFSLYT
ncbi:CLUMA_CG016655, isoform A [Clunio marinus]|uniref:CLUMA_CG016655, isoform A n=1 Tax=Clunio marinus TaxID=568069 RepID=A0A1J1IU84_9DIPT|nr:CLUMA_CG016655, isoform A [Clunio marinus]